MPASGRCTERWERRGGERKEESVGSGKGMGFGMGMRGREGMEMPRVSASMRSSRAVMTQSVSRTGACEEAGIEAVVGRQYVSVSSTREASSFLSKQGIRATCQIWSGRMWRCWLRTVLRSVPVRAWGDLRRER